MNSDEARAEQDKRTLYVNGLSEEVDLEILGGLLINVNWFFQSQITINWYTSGIILLKKYFPNFSGRSIGRYSFCHRCSNQTS